MELPWLLMPWETHTFLDGDTGQKFVAQVWVGGGTPEAVVSSAVRIFNAAATSIADDGAPHPVLLDTALTPSGTDLAPALGTNQILVNTTGWYDVVVAWAPAPAGADDDTVLFLTINGAVQLSNPPGNLNEFLDGVNNIRQLSPSSFSARTLLTAGDAVGVSAVVSAASTGPCDILASLTISGPAVA